MSLTRIVSGTTVSDPVLPASRFGGLRVGIAGVECHTPRMSIRPLTLIGIIISIVTGLSLGVLAFLHQQAATPSPAEDTVRAALREVANNYVEQISDQQLTEYAIEGIMRGLDEHSDYLDPSSYQSLNTSTTGKFGGIGIELGLVDDYFTVIAPIDDTPASSAGLLAGDRIVGINGESAKGKKLSDVIDILRGAPGTTVTLSIESEAAPSREVELERAEIRIASVKSRMLAPGYGYLRISQFQTSTGQDVAEHLEQLQDEHGGELEGLVLDLRNNPGGTLLSSVEVADHFLDSGTIVSTAGRQPISEAKYAATRGDLLAGKPMVVLINSGSASASEIVAAALKDQQRATIVGSTSYGKGSVQSVLPLDGAQALKLTTAYYYSPNGDTIHEIGVAPDIPLQLEEEALLDEAVTLLRGKQSEHLQARLPLGD